MKLVSILLTSIVLCGCGTPLAHTVGSRYEPEERKAMNLHRKENPRCIVCGSKSINKRRSEVHHILPRSRHPELRACSTNFVTLCRIHHIWIGHPGGTRNYNANLMNTIKAVRDARDATIIYGVKE